MSSTTDTLFVFVLALVTALATGLGAVPFARVRHPDRTWLGIGNAAAGGLMTAASAGLVAEGWHIDPLRTLGGLTIGAVLLAISRRLLDRRRNLHLGTLRGADARKALLIVGVMTVHSIAEGVGIGVSFGGGLELGLFISIAIAVHNIPEGLAISLVLVPRGQSVWRAAGWSIFSSLPQPLLAVPAFLFVIAFSPLLPWGLGFAAGAMLWMVATELMPESLAVCSRGRVWLVILAAAAAMGGFQALLRG